MNLGIKVKNLERNFLLSNSLLVTQGKKGMTLFEEKKAYFLFGIAERCV